MLHWYGRAQQRFLKTLVCLALTQLLERSIRDRSGSFQAKGTQKPQAHSGRSRESSRIAAERGSDTLSSGFTWSASQFSVAKADSLAM